MAALVPWHLCSDMIDVCGMLSLFPHLVLLENSPKATKIEDETWWRPYWTNAEVEKAKLHQEKSNQIVDPYDSYMRSVYELYAQLNSNHRIYDIAVSFDRGPYYQCQFNKWI